MNAVAGRYQWDHGGAWLLLVDYPNEDLAAAAESGAAETGIAVRRQGSRLAVVLAPEPAAAAEGLLENAWGGGE